MGSSINNLLPFAHYIAVYGHSSLAKYLAVPRVRLDISFGRRNRLQRASNKILSTY